MTKITATITTTIMRTDIDPHRPLLRPLRALAVVAALCGCSGTWREIPEHLGHVVAVEETGVRACLHEGVASIDRQEFQVIRTENLPSSHPRYHPQRTVVVGRVRMPSTSPAGCALAEVLTGQPADGDRLRSVERGG